jgi:hypothetical protein
MVNSTVQGLPVLVRFLNMKTLHYWSRDARLVSVLDDEEMMHRWLFWWTGDKDTAESLLDLQRDLGTDIRRLLDPQIPAETALNDVLDKIDSMNPERSRRVSPEATEKDHPQMVELVRVIPPSDDQKNRQSPRVHTLAVIESQYDKSAREAFYTVLDRAIRNNVVSTIRCCLECGSFFLRKGKRLTYCSEKCETAFNNKRRAPLLKKRRDDKIKQDAELEAARKAETEQERLHKSTAAFLKRAANNTKGKDEGVNAIMTLLGGGTPMRGNKRVAPWLKKPPAEFLNSLEKGMKAKFAVSVKEHGI